MFGRRKREVNPADYIPKPTRIVAIIQLCLAFTLASWVMIQPAMHGYFSHQSTLGLYKTVLGDEDLLVKVRPEDAPALAAKLRRNATRFEQLDENTQQRVLAGYEKRQQAPKVGWGEKFRRALRILALDLNPFAQGWIFFSVLIALLLLCRIEGAQLAAWLLPLLVVCYGADKYMHGQAALPPPDASLYPTEEVIFRDYLQEAPDESILTQREQLLRGWQLYLVKRWADETPSDDPDRFAQQVEDGEYGFNLARLKAIEEATPLSPLARMRAPDHPLLLLVYLAWNLFFAWFVNRPRAIV